MTTPFGFGQTPLSAALAVALAPAMELAITGFETGSLFDPAWLRQTAENKKMFNVVSLQTQTTYTLILLPGTQTDTTMHALLVGIGENWLDETKMRKLTVVKGGTDSRMLIHPGWRNGV